MSSRYSDVGNIQNPLQTKLDMLNQIMSKNFQQAQTRSEPSRASFKSKPKTERSGPVRAMPAMTDYSWVNTAA
jgi:hypothetical protein